MRLLAFCMEDKKLGGPAKVTDPPSFFHFLQQYSNQGFRYTYQVLRQKFILVEYPYDRFHPFSVIRYT